MLFVTLLFTLVVWTLEDPELLSLSSKNECIRSLVSSFVSSETCSKLSQNSKSQVKLSLFQLALKMTNCLFEQMGKPKIICEKKTIC